MTPAEVVEAFRIDMDGVDPDTDEGLELIQDYLNDNTMVCGVTTATIVFQAF